MKETPSRCYGCDALETLNDLGLCESCVEKLERDLIRARDWEYSVTVFGMSREAREAKHAEIIAKHGSQMELIEAAPPKRPRRQARRSTKKRPPTK